MPKLLASITLSLGLIPIMALGESVAEFVDPEVPQLEFAAGDIKSGLMLEAGNIFVHNCCNMLTGTNCKPIGFACRLTGYPIVRPNLLLPLLCNLHLNS